ncbi:hypothetical protein TEA_028437 [Camellia sinensis var. sinensis]|uniref:Large ribosomal subunit protein uL2 C-terminal domain-containing protein n=1 Tax=Camellia sinensis var. sinensis TaxID=542762 RepID=A0A4S4CVM2_CAMSN|nr:hypothetical protein TEA_028437 [Camellia sinensis var. sinensis]
MTAQKKKQTQKTRRKKNGNLLCKGDDRALYSMPRWSSTSHRLPGKGRRMGPIMGHTMHYRHKISSSTSRKPYALEEACTVWEGVLIDQKEESTSTDMPLGTAIHNIEITLGKGGQLVRAAGAVAKLIAKEGKSATLKLPSGEVRLISKNCSATVGQVGNVGVNQKSLGRAGSKRWLEFIAGQLKNRVSFRKAMKKAIELTEQTDTKGIQVQIAGRIDGKEIARVEWIREGVSPEKAPGQQCLMMMFDGSFDGPDTMGFGSLIPTKRERSLMECVRQELKHELKQDPEGKGSLHFFLKAKGWATSISAGVGDEGMHRSLIAYIFGMSIHLTDSGLEKNLTYVDDWFLILIFYKMTILEKGELLEICSQCKTYKINDLFSEGGKELQDIGNMEFRFAEEQPQDDYAAELADNLLVYPPKHIIYGDYAFKVWDEEIIEYVLGFFKRKNMRVDVVSKSFAKSQGSLNVICKKIYFLFAGCNSSKWFSLHNI